jgi:hypothetical protein
MAKQYMRKVPGLRRLYQTLRLLYSLHRTGNFRFVYPYTPGHYYSPLPDYKEVLARSQVLFDRDTAGCVGIDLREEAQLELLDSFSYYYDDLPFPREHRAPMRYYYENAWFTYGDAIILYSVLRYYKPTSIIEIGSGFSSAAMLDVNRMFLEDKIHFTFIEPHPERIFSLFTREDKDNHMMLQSQVQDVPPEVFQTLSANDILFVDSSHVAKVGSDVAHILFDILPELKPGVIVHFHDIYWPFEYPENWILAGRAWNESYFLRTFLQFNDTFEIVYFNSFIQEHHANILQRKMPLCLKQPLRLQESDALFPYGPCSLWLKKVL